MEEEKNTQQPTKLSYENLQAIASGLSQQNEHLKKELEAMREYISEQQTQSIFAYLNEANRIVEHNELFDTDFIGTILDDIKKVMLMLRQIIVPENKEDKDGRESSSSD